MRLSRLRISISTILFAVAVIAVNCAVYRYLNENCGTFDEDSVLSLFSDGFIEGVIPLLNVAMIGSLVYLTKRLRSFRRGHAANARTSPAGVTYFSLHFLAICCLTSIFMQEASHEVLRPAVDYGPRGWLEALESRALVVPSVLFFGIWVSGPPLVLSGIGALLATRCAATVTRRRFRAMTCLVSFGFASVAMALWVSPRPFAGDLDVDLDFQIVDKDSRQPIAAAFLRMTDPFDSRSTAPMALSGPDGRARLTGRFPVSVQRCAFLTFGGFSSWGRWLEISAPSYQTIRIPLPHVLGPYVKFQETYRQTVVLTRRGDRRYSCEADDRNLQHFCRAIRLTPTDPANCGPLPYCLESDPGKPQPGLSPLRVRVWVTFLLNELSPRNINDLGNPRTDL